MSAPDPLGDEWPDRAAEILRALPEIRTERLLLRRMRVEDAAAMFEYARDPQVALHASWSPHRSIEDSRAFLETIVASYERGQSANWGIVLGSKFIGTVGFGVNFPHRNAEVGYALAREHWGKGYATEAARATLDFGFRALGLHRMFARCVPENVGSWKVMRNADMRFEGIQRGSYFAKGKFDDLMIWSTLRTDR